MNATLFAFTGLAALAANLPFMTNRIFGLRKGANAGKSFGWRLAEMFALYAVMLGIGVWLEMRQGPVQQQHWQFYVTNLALFFVAAWPGFVWRYLWRKSGQ